MNKVILMGRIASDLELKTTPNGVSVCPFRLAVDRNYQKKGEEKVTDFINITAWRSNAEFISKWFAKGRLILIEGEYQTRQYTDKNGNPATWHEIVVGQAYFTGEKGAESGGNTASGFSHVPTQNAQSVANNAQSAPGAATASKPQSAASYGDGQAASPAVTDADDYPF